MARHGIPSFSSLWQRHEDLYVRIFIIALKRMSDDGCEVTKEDLISDLLCPFLHAVCFEESKSNDNFEIRVPDWEKSIQAVNKSELKGGKGKRPDFTCKLTNTLANCADDYEIPFHVECKLLGSPTSPRWILNKNYVTEGIKRFDSRSHEYGKRASSGMMLGYVISMTPEKILEEINSHQKKHFSDNPAIEFECVRENIQQYGQKLERKNLEPRKFKLIHLWVDLRK
jgi:hypothetical protein